MSGDLGDRMRAAAGSGPRPPVGRVWTAGSRRRLRRRLAAAAAGGAALILVIALAATAIDGGDGSERVASGPDATTGTIASEDATCDPMPSREDGPTPATADSFVNGGSGRPSGPSDVVARAKVLRSWWLEPETVGPDEQYWHHRIELEVTDSVTGAEVGDRLLVFDAIAFGGSEEPEGVAGATCHQFEVGDDVIVALAAPPATAPDQPHELNGSSAFFVITDGRFSPELDAARRRLGATFSQEWGDSELLQQARDLTPDQFLDVLRDAVPEPPRTEAEPGDHATWTVSPEGEPSPTGSTFTALVTRTGCAGGETGTVLRPGIRLLEDAVEIRFTVEALPPGTIATCQGNTAVPVEVDIGEPLGTRVLVDDACNKETQAAGTAACLPEGKRWPR